MFYYNENNDRKDLSGKTWYGAMESKFRLANLCDVLFDQDTDDCDFAFADMTDSTFSGAEFTGCNFIGADLNYTKAVECKFENCNFSGALMRKISFQDCRFVNCKFNGIHARDSRWTRCKFCEKTEIKGLLHHSTIEGCEGLSIGKAIL